MTHMSRAESAPFMVAFRDLMDDQFRTYLTLSDKVGGLVQQHSKMVEAAINEQYQFIGLAVEHNEPTQDTLAALMKKSCAYVEQIQNFRAANRATPWFDHLSAISESIAFLGWVTVKPTPAPHVKEMIDASQYYTNKVLVANKDKNQVQCEWARSWVAFLTELMKYIRQHHTTGLAWNKRGPPVTAVALGSSSSGPIPPPPPPPPPSDLFADLSFSGQSANNDRMALLADINKGSDITKGLRRVTADQQTHKNANLRTQAPLASKATPGSRATSSPATATVTQPPKFELSSGKWFVANQIGQKTIEISETEMNQSVFIYKCRDCLIIVKGKVNCITVDSCSKLSIVFDDIVSFVEFINCQSVKGQSMGRVPTINVEKTDSAEVYLNPKCLDVELVTAKSSAVNVSVPGADGDFVEYPIPEQFKSIWSGRGFKTEPADKSV